MMFDVRCGRFNVVSELVLSPHGLKYSSTALDGAGAPDVISQKGHQVAYLGAQIPVATGRCEIVFNMLQLHRIRH